MKIDLQALINHDGALARKCVGLYDLKMAGRISQEALDYELCLILVDMLDSFSPRGIPRQPLKLADFYSFQSSPKYQEKTGREQRAIMNETLKDPTVVEYYEELNERVADDFSRATNLEWMIKTFMKHKDEKRAVRCWEVYKTFPATLSFGRSRVWTKKKVSNEL